MSTPKDLLEEVKTRFVTLFHNDEVKLKNLLKQAMRTYQDKAGVVKKITIESPQLTVSIPANFDGLVACGNKNGSRVPVSVSGDNFNLSAARASDYPLTLSYFVDLKGVDFESYELPSEIESHIADYLEALIRIPNSQREAVVAAAGGFDTSHIPSEADLRARLESLELEMESQLVLPTVSVR
ncbi:hypothetical protein NTE19_003363 [Vibrio fluvialis]|nr:hypothetical protein [Vibrio fluvialis]